MQNYTVKLLMLVLTISGIAQHTSVDTFDKALGVVTTARQQVNTARSASANRSSAGVVDMPTQRSVPSTGFANVEGGSLYYEIRGEGEPVILIHGGLVDSRIWDDQMKPFATGHTVIRYDLRGFGKSSMPTSKFSNVTDLYSLCTTLGVKRAHLVGVSLGGSIAMDFALEYPKMVESMILVDSALRGDVRPPDEKLQSIYRSSRSDGSKKFSENMLTTPLFAGVRADSKLRLRMLQMLSDNLKALPTFGLWQQPSFKTIDRLADLKVPTLIIVGSLDHPDLLGISEVLHVGIIGSQKTVISGASHHPNAEQVKEFNSIVLRFLKEIAKRNEKTARSRSGPHALRIHPAANGEFP